jgi:hypothetical protein
MEMLKAGDGKSLKENGPCFLSKVARLSRLDVGSQLEKSCSQSVQLDVLIPAAPSALCESGKTNA